MDKNNKMCVLSQSAFEGVSQKLREKLTESQQRWISHFTKEIDLERLQLLVTILFECIMLVITTPKAMDDDIDIVEIP